MNNYLLENVIEFSAVQAQGKTLLIVHKLHRTPYHVGIIYGDYYYALTVKGPEKIDGKVMVELLADKTNNNLILELLLPGPEVDAAKFFNQSALDHLNFQSCLFPIKNLIAALTTNNKFTEANNLFELLDLLMEHNLVGQKMATRITPLMESKIVLMRYDTEAIKKHIKRLQEKNAGEQGQKYIS